MLLRKYTVVLLTVVVLCVCSVEGGRRKTAGRWYKGVRKKTTGLWEEGKKWLKLKRRPAKTEDNAVSLDVSAKNVTADDRTRSSRFLSIFTIVRFENSGCSSQGGDNGTCVTKAQCIKTNGMAAGQCAQGFGVCCLYVLGCGSTSDKNCTYFVNENYPSSYKKIGFCQLTVNKMNDDICQLRVDFDTLNMKGPDTTDNSCSQDQFLITGGSPVPTICGQNSGQHMYIHTGVGMKNPVILTAVTSDTTYDRSWKVKIQQIPCTAIYAADSGCLQYFTGITGTIKSFNKAANTGVELANQMYTVCVRAWHNFCGIKYGVCTEADSFSVSGTETTNAKQGSTNCATLWVGIPCASATGDSPCHDRFCGSRFSDTDADANNKDLTSKVLPFRLMVNTKTPTADNKGFCLNYSQVPCS